MNKEDTRTPKETKSIFERMTKALVKGRPQPKKTKKVDAKRGKTVR